MDLAKFVSLLQTNNLYFARADKLGDPFEGAITKVDAALRQLIKTNRLTHPHLSAYKDFTDDQLNAMFSQHEKLNRQKLTELYVNCWHMNEHESAAMWRLYSQASEAICIQSTFQRLSTVLPTYVNIGVVAYKDYEREFIPAENLFNSIMTKRISFAHERELRAVAWSHLAPELGGDIILANATSDGLQVPVNLAAIIENVYISPTSAAWFRNVVEHLLARHSLTVPVLHSSLAGTPLY